MSPREARDRPLGARASVGPSFPPASPGAPRGSGRTRGRSCEAAGRRVDTEILASAYVAPTQGFRRETQNGGRNGEEVKSLPGPFLTKRWRPATRAGSTSERPLPTGPGRPCVETPPWSDSIF